jgi:hypothetical protein
LSNLLKKYEVEFQQSNTFWNLTFTSLRESMLIRLCRIYEENKKTVNLNNLLETIKKNIEMFEEKKFRVRLKNNPFIDSLAKSNRIPDSKQLQKDIKNLNQNNPLIKKLIIWRNNTIAHKNLKISLGKNKRLKDNLFSESDINILLNNSLEIFNRYSKLFLSSSSSTHIIDHYDYKSIFKFMRLGLEKWEEDIEKEV